MPTTEIALLRGINVGRAKRIAMADLRAMVEELGYSDVRTVLNSGNVVFTTSRASKGDAARIEKGIEANLGITSRVTVLTAAELAEIIDENPLADAVDNPSRFLIAVSSDKSVLERLKPLLERDWSPEALAVGKHAAYIWCPNGIAVSEVVEHAGRALGDGVTMRNLATMMKLQALAQKEK